MSVALRISVFANVLLLGTVAILIWRDQPATPPAPVTSTPIKPAHPESPSPSQASHSAVAASGINPNAVTQLQQLGLSQDAVVTAILEDFNRRSTQQVADLQKKYAPRLVPDRVMVEFGRQNELDRVQTLKQALGEEGYRAWDKEQTLHELNRARPPGDEIQMSSEEAEEAYRLQKDYDEKAKELQEAMEDGVADRADGGALQAQAQQALDVELEKLLGKDRFEQLRGNVDSSTEVYRLFGDLNPTPEQAKSVAQVQSDYRAKEAALTKQLNDDPANANLAAQLKALNDSEDQNLRQIFGADAYDNMKRQNDPTYKTLKQYADTWQMSDQQVQSVYDAVHAFQDQAERTREAAEMSQSAGQHVNWREVNASIDQARQQAEAGLQTIVGADRLRRLEQNGVLSNR